MNGALPRVCLRGPHRGNRFALTFDDGPHPDTTPRLLAALAQHGAKATFFLLGSRVIQWPELAVAISEAGHTVASHGHDHRRDWWRSSRTLGEDLDRAEDVIGGLIPEPKLFRPPYGWLGPGWYRAARKRGYASVLWNVSSSDWRKQDAVRIARHVSRRIHAGSIVLFHDCRAETGEGYPHTVEAVRRVLDVVAERGLSSTGVVGLFCR